MTAADAPSGGARVIGVDFDNTVIRYDALMHAIALAEDMIPDGVPSSKGAIRAHLRAKPGGEDTWQRLQALAYGEEIHRASVMPGAPAFFERCRARRVRVYVVSHKTERAAAAPNGPNLRSAALGWLEQNGFFASAGGLSPSHVLFGGTRQQKIDFIRMLGCTHFIDDLLETFAEPTFPVGVRRVLFSPEGGQAPDGVLLARSWDDASRIALDDGR